MLLDVNRFYFFICNLYSLRVSIQIQFDYDT
jgi:hypothetical protein